MSWLAWSSYWYHADTLVGSMKHLACCQSFQSNSRITQLTLHRTKVLKKTPLRPWLFPCTVWLMSMRAFSFCGGFGHATFSRGSPSGPFQQMVQLDHYYADLHYAGSSQSSKMTDKSVPAVTWLRLAMLCLHLPEMTSSLKMYTSVSLYSSIALFLREFCIYKRPLGVLYAV